MQTNKEAYKAKLQSHLKVWSARFRGFRAKAEKAAGEVRQRLLKQSDELELLEASARKHIADLESSAEDNWQKDRDAMDKTWHQLSSSVEAVWARILLRN